MSKGQYNKKYYGRHANRERRWDWFVVVIIIIVLTLCTGLYRYRDKIQPVHASLSAKILQVKAWFAERKSRQKVAMAKSKNVANNDNDESQGIHFEFYTTLSNSQMTTTPPKPKLASAEPTIASSDELEKEFSAKITKESRKHLTNKNTDEGNDR